MRATKESVSENENSAGPAREHAVLCVLVDVELDPSALDVDAVADVAHAIGSTVAARVVAQGVTTRGYAVRLARCSLGGLTMALERAAKAVGDGH